jgi:hypothetical protein
MNHRRNARICASVESAGEEDQDDGPAERAPREDWLDLIIIFALWSLVRTAEPAAAAWTRIQEHIEARRQATPTSEVG